MRGPSAHLTKNDPFRKTRSTFHRAMYLFVKLCVFCLFVQLRLSPGRVWPGIRISQVIVARAKSV